MPEFAFIGRSNVGKSSLLNMLAGQEGLARVSPMPGFTKMINFFVMSKRWRLVDLPGYGFAHVAREDSARFNRAVNDYIQQRKNLALVFALIDSTLAPQTIDLEFVEWLTTNSVPFILVFTKTDKVTPAIVQANIAAFTDRISGWYEKLPTILTCSSTTGRGRTELLQVIGEFLRAHAEEIPPAPIEQSRAKVELPEDSPPKGFPIRATSEKKKRTSRARPW